MEDLTSACEQAAGHARFEDLDLRETPRGSSCHGLHDGLTALRPVSGIRQNAVSSFPKRRYAPPVHTSVAAVAGAGTDATAKRIGIPPEYRMVK